MVIKNHGFLTNVFWLHGCSSCLFPLVLIKTETMHHVSVFNTDFSACMSMYVLPYLDRSQLLSGIDQPLVESQALSQTWQDITWHDVLKTLTFFSFCQLSLDNCHFLAACLQLMWGDYEFMWTGKTHSALLIFINIKMMSGVVTHICFEA